MKKIIVTAALLLALVMAPACALADFSFGLETPDFAVYDAQGGTVTLSGVMAATAGGQWYDTEDGTAVLVSEAPGCPVIVNLWATWCPPCRAELGYFDEAAKTYGEKISFMMIDLTDGEADTLESVTAFVEGNGYTFPVYYDMDYSATNAYGVEAIPTSLFITADGKLLRKVVGSMEQEELQQYIDELLAYSDTLVY